MAAMGNGLDRARTRMTEAGVADAAVEAFSHYYRQLEEGHRGTIAESEIAPLTELATMADESPSEDDREAFAATAMIKLNGGLGTSMGMTRAKSLLPVREGRSFLDLIVEQVRRARAEHGVKLPLVLMDSFRTRTDSLAVLEAAGDVAVDGLPLDFLQSQEPKLDAETLEPVEWSADPDLEWCPPGHGDIYPSLLDSGLLEQLIEAGYRYAFVSNADNLGAAPSAQLAGWFARSGAPFAMEVCRRTAADRKGGHLAVRRRDEQLVLREKAQVEDGDATAFGDIETHRYFNTNNLWLDLQSLLDVLRERDGVLGLPMISNSKTVDPSDKSSTAVLQIETAMGAAIEVFPGATAIEVPRDRFRPVKTTGDLLVIRSDAYELDDQARLVAVRDRDPLVDLGEHYTTIADFDARFPAGPPSLREADSLSVEGDWTFGAGVRVVGEVALADAGEPRTVDPGTVLS